MPYLKAKFDELIERIRQGRDLNHASFEPVYYLVFPPSLILDVKRALPAWTSRLRNEGWDVHIFSIASHIISILSTAAPRKIWLSADRKAPRHGSEPMKRLQMLFRKGLYNNASKSN
jgi:hypothetical protein